MLSADPALMPRTLRERIMAPLLRRAMQLMLKPVLAPHVPIAEQRRRVERLARLTRPKNILVEPATVGGVPGEWLRLPAMSRGAILYFHGGGFCLGTAATHRALTAALARAANLPLFAADYRLAPEHPFPAAADDAIAAARALAAGGPLVIAGDSAGGLLALTAALAVRPQALVLFSPWIELTRAYPGEPDGETTLSASWLGACARHYLAGSAFASPLDADLSSLPPTLIQAGTDELLHDDAVRLHDALERADVPVRCEIVPDRWHVFHLHAGWLPSADAAIARAAAFIQQSLG